MNTEDIVALKNELVDRDAPRHNRYDLNMAAIGGSYDYRRLEGFWETYSLITNRPVPADREQYEFRINFIPSIISAARKFLAVIPSLKCPTAKQPPAGDTAMRKQAERLERVYLGFWNYSHIGKRMNQLAYWNPALGSTVGVVWPDVENKRPMLQMRSPYGCYPVLADIDGQKFKQVIFYTKYKKHQVAANYPSVASKVMDLEGDVPVLQYLDESEIVTIVNDEWRVKDIENKWGFVPCSIIPNEAFGEGPWGDSDIEWVIPVQEEYIYRQTLKTVILDQTILQPLAVEGGDNLPREIPMGPRDVIPVLPGGKVYRVPPVQVPFQYLQSENDLVGLIDRLGNVPDVMRSQFEGSVLTGRGVSTLLGPMEMGFNVKGNEIYPTMANLNKMAMRMWHAMWPRKQHTVFHLDRANAMQVETFRTGEFEGFYENIVYVDASNYFDATSMFMRVLQATQNRLMSRRTARQFTPGVDDPVYEEELIKAEFEEDLLLQQAAAAFEQANVQPDLGAQTGTNYALNQGFEGETPTPEPVGGFEPGMKPPAAQMGEEPGEGELLDDMIEFFQDIPLRGKVWLAGGIVMDPAYSPGSPDYSGVEVYLENPGDKSAINTTMRNEFPDVWGHLVYHEGPPSPEEPSILVYDPAGGTETGGEEDELAAMMAGAPQPVGMPGGSPGMPPEPGGVV